MEIVPKAKDVSSPEWDESGDQMCDYQSTGIHELDLCAIKNDAKDSKMPKRKKIRAILNEEALSSATLSAQNAERERLKRVAGVERTATCTFSVSSENFADNKVSETCTQDEHAVETKRLDEIILSSDEDEPNLSSVDSSPTKKLKISHFASAHNDKCHESDSDVVCLGSDVEDIYSPEPSTDGHDLSFNDDNRFEEDLNSNGKMLVNVGHPSGDPDIFISSHLCKVLKPHQLGGIRFMYSNIVESLQAYRSSPGFGCILAHSMGLGKTLQVICFIDIFYSYTPGKRILILVPINTLSNWVNEFERWLPQKPMNDSYDNSEGRKFDVIVLNEKCRTPKDRFSVVERWFQMTGVLLMGYEMFRLLTNKDLSASKRKNNSKTLISQEDNAISEEKRIARSDELRQMLIEIGPDLVVCDEGHRIKNLLTNTAKALNCIRTRRRIVLTGYPLQNNMLEYWCMVNFVRPNFLGSKHEFANMFERPIKNGQCVDSTPSDRKIMRQRVHVLTNMLKGFVQRNALQGVLKGEERTANTSSTDSSLQPYRNADNCNSIDFRWADDILEGYSPGRCENGFKILLTLSILERSALIGDKLLLFSQSLLTLDLIEEYLCKNYIPGSTEKWSKNKSYFRLDGSTCSSEREKLISRFSQDTSVSLFLISTRAGSLGINLVAANRVIVLDASWNPCHDAQAVCRVFRYGQIKPTFIYRLIVDNSMERMIFNRQIGKQGMSDTIIDEKTVDALVSRDDLLNLLQYDENLDASHSDWELDPSVIEDDLLSDICKVYKNCLSQQPIPHESLFLDRSDQHLSAREKREAQRNYEREKRALHGGSTEGYHSIYRHASEPSNLNKSCRDRLSMDPLHPLNLTLLPTHVRCVEEMRSRNFNGGELTAAAMYGFSSNCIGPTAESVRLISPQTLTLPSKHIPGTVGLIIVGEPIDVIKHISFSTLVRTSNGHILDASGSIFDRPLNELTHDFAPRPHNQRACEENNEQLRDESVNMVGNFSPVEIILSSDDEDLH